MKKVDRISAALRSARMRGSASNTPKRPWESVTGSWTPRAIQSVSASRSNVNAQAPRASLGQRGGGEAAAGFVIGALILAQAAVGGQPARPPRRVTGLG